MDTVTLRTRRLVLSTPVPDDAPLVLEYCQDPLFERYLTTPWPYTAADADRFLGAYVASGWAFGRELTWALRPAEAGELLGVISARLQPEPRTYDVGFWLGAAHRGHGYMPEALDAVTEWLFGIGLADTVRWECLPGNAASARTAQKAGFAYAGLAPVRVPARDGSYPESWHGVRHRDAARMAALEQAWPI